MVDGMAWSGLFFRCDTRSILTIELGVQLVPGILHDNICAGAITKGYYRAPPYSTPCDYGLKVWIRMFATLNYICSTKSNDRDWFEAVVGCSCSRRSKDAMLA